ncbi:hypothetical protein Tco_1130636 [Tanacetum coccineum]
MFAASNVQACEMCKPYFELWYDGILHEGDILVVQASGDDLDSDVDSEMQASMWILKRRKVRNAGLDIDSGVDFEMQALADDLKMPDANSESAEAVAKERTKILTPVPMAMLRCILNSLGIALLGQKA